MLKLQKDKLYKYNEIQRAHPQTSGKGGCFQVDIFTKMFSFVIVFNVLGYYKYQGQLKLRPITYLFILTVYAYKVAINRYLRDDTSAIVTGSMLSIFQDSLASSTDRSGLSYFGYYFSDRMVHISTSPPLNYHILDREHKIQFPKKDAKLCLPRMSLREFLSTFHKHGKMLLIIDCI